MFTEEGGRMFSFMCFCIQKWKSSHVCSLHQSIVSYPAPATMSRWYLERSGLSSSLSAENCLYSLLYAWYKLFMNIALVSTGLRLTISSNSMTIRVIIWADRGWTHGGWFLMKDFKALSCNVHPRDGGRKAASIQFIVCKARNGLTMIGHCIPCVYPMSTWRHHTCLHMFKSPRPSPSVLQTASDRRTEVGKAAIVSHDQCERHIHQGYGHR